MLPTPHHQNQLSELRSSPALSEWNPDGAHEPHCLFLPMTSQQLALCGVEDDTSRNYASSEHQQNQTIVKPMMQSLEKSHFMSKRNFWLNSWGTFPTKKAEGTQSLEIQDPSIAVNGCPSLGVHLIRSPKTCWLTVQPHPLFPCLNSSCRMSIALISFSPGIRTWTATVPAKICLNMFQCEEVIWNDYNLLAWNRGTAMGI